MARTGATAAWLVGSACGPSYAPPCAVVGERVVVSAAGKEAARYGQLGAQRLRPMPPVTRSDGSGLFRWWRSEPPVGTASSAATSTAAGLWAEWVIVAPDGAPTGRGRLRVQSDPLRPERYTDFGWTGDGIALTYAQSTVETGTTASSRQLALLALPEDGSAPARIPLAHCDDCDYAWASAFHRGRHIVAYETLGRVLRGGATPATGPPERVIELQSLTPEGMLLRERRLMVTDTGSPPGAPFLELRPDPHGLLLRTGSELRLLDEALTETAAPVRLPTAQAVRYSAYDGGGRQAAWLKDATAGSGAWSSDLFLGAFDPSGNASVPEERISTATALFAVARFGDRAAVLFRDLDQDYLALAHAPHARKIGGDLPLGRPTEAALPESEPILGLLTPHGESIVAYFQRAAREVRRVEVRCVP